MQGQETQFATHNNRVELYPRGEYLDHCRLNMKFKPFARARIDSVWTVNRGLLSCARSNLKCRVTDAK